MPEEKSYAELLRESLAVLPIRKKCCIHAMHDAERLYREEKDPNTRASLLRAAEEAARCPGCVAHFVRALFVRNGSVTDPDKRNHLECSFESEAEANALAEVLASQGIPAHVTARKKRYICYMKDGEAIADFLAYIGANTAAFTFMNNRIRREIRNNANRVVNCDTANIEKSLMASERQIAVIRQMKDSEVLGRLPDSLRETAELRLQYEQLSLKELGERHNPPITKSGVSHRLAKLEAFAHSIGMT